MAHTNKYYSTAPANTGYLLQVTVCAGNLHHTCTVGRAPTAAAAAAWVASKAAPAPQPSVYACQQVALPAAVTAVSPCKAVR